MPRGIRFELTPDERMERWRPLVHWIVGIPYAVVALVLIPVVVVLVLIGGVGVLATGRWPSWAAARLVGIHRFQFRVATFLWLLRRDLPRLSLAAELDDPGGDPLQLGVPEPSPSSRWVPLTRWLLALPLIVAALVLSIGGLFSTAVAAVSIMTTGGWPNGLAEYAVTVAGRQAQLLAYAEFLSDQPPRFSNI